MIKHINQNTRCHIITIEDPIEFLHRDELASINQREVGIDVLNFADALRAALRQDPNIILVGEIRDLETMEIALRAAETGHLVFSTLHTTDAVQTVTRLVESFPQHQQNQARVRIASTLKAVISQRLLERNNIDGRVLAVEIMIVNAAIKEYLSSPYQADRIPPYL
jgi:twitching motility protein PilT